MEIIEQSKQVPIETVQNWDKNPRKIMKDDFARLKKQIIKFKQYKPLVCYQENGNLVTIGGNMRIRALKELGYKDVWITVAKFDDEQEKIEVALSDNDRAGSYDEDALAELVYPFKELMPLEDYKVDLSPATIDLRDVLSSVTGDDEDNFDVEKALDQIKEPKSKRGDIFLLGSHRLMCGSATDKADVEKLMEGGKADMVFTDPPYNVDYKGTKHDKIMGDNQTEEEFVEFTLAFIERMKEAMKPGGTFYICSGYSSYPIFLYAIKTQGLDFSTPIIWVKNNTSLGWGDYRHKHEMVLKAKKTRSQKKAQPILSGNHR